MMGNFILSCTIYLKLVILCLAKRQDVLQNLFVDSPARVNEDLKMMSLKSAEVDIMNNTLVADHLKLSEGDVLVNDVDASPVEKKKEIRKNEDAVKLWPGGRVIYSFDSSIRPPARRMVLQAMKHIESKTCLKFIPRSVILKKWGVTSDQLAEYKKSNLTIERELNSTSSTTEATWTENFYDDELFNFIRIYKGPRKSCFSMIGKRDGNWDGQRLSLGAGCFYHGVIVHELVHAIGLRHMHSRPDRDRYLRILWSNIREDMRSQFRRMAKVQSAVDTMAVKLPFDYDSIMLYGAKLFSSNGGDTMIATKDGVDLLDTAIKYGLSQLDAKCINKLYKCPKLVKTWIPMVPVSSTTFPSTTLSQTIPWRKEKSKKPYVKNRRKLF